MITRSRASRTVSIDLPVDREGYLGRQCPSADCRGYFKVTPGTGLAVEDCGCPYCGRRDDAQAFATDAQQKYAVSVVEHQFVAELNRQFGQLGRRSPPSRGGFGIGLSLTVTPARLPWIRHYQERTLETPLTCECSLRYTIYGVFAFCPDCGVHNNLQILQSNLGIIAKQVELALTLKEPLRTKLLDNALEDCVSTFDGWARAVVDVHYLEKSRPKELENLSFQNLEGVRKKLTDAGLIDLVSQVPSDAWQGLVRLFQKRHVLSHRMGVIDEDYIKKTADPGAVVGRKVSVTPDEIIEGTRTLGALARGMARVLTLASSQPTSDVRPNQLQGE